MAKGKQKHLARKGRVHGARRAAASGQAVAAAGVAGAAAGAPADAAASAAAAEPHVSRVAGSSRDARGDVPARVAPGFPRCPHARACGACQHVNEPYDAQLARKNERMAQLFAEFESVRVLPILGMEHPYHYRNKVISPYAPGRKLARPAGEGAASRRRYGKDGRPLRGGGKGKDAAAPVREILCGMYAAGTHRIVATDECLVENERAKKVVLAVRALMPKFGLAPYDEDAGTGFLRHAVVRVGHTSDEMLVTLVTNGEEFPASRAFCRELVRRCPFVTTVVQNVNERQTNVILGERERTLYGPGFILDKLCGLSFRISSQSFYQVNAVQTEVLYRQAVELARLSGGERVIDAYCGTGTIGLVAASHGAAEVIGVDSVASAIRDARENARHNGVENARFVAEDAGVFMRRLAAEGQHVDAVLMDPPRAGSSEEFLDSLVQLGPDRVVYISCNPQTQARDCRRLRDHGYELETVQPVDMFPHTDHVETVACLTRRPGAGH